MSGSGLTSLFARARHGDQDAVTGAFYATLRRSRTPQSATRSPRA